MGSSVSSNCTRKIHRTSTAEKEVNRKENTVGKDCQKATDSNDYNAQIPIWPSSIPIRNVLQQEKRLLAQFLLPFKFTVTFKNRIKQWFENIPSSESASKVALSRLCQKHSTFHIMNFMKTLFFRCRNL